MKKTIVLTTINEPNLLKDYTKNLSKFGQDNVDFMVIGDVPTPNKKANEIILDVKEQGFEAEYYDVASQKKWLRDFPQIAKIIPYRSDNRRNIGFLMAVEKGTDIIITIDDDNYATDENFSTYHSIVGKRVTLPTVTSTSGWFNPCIMLETDHGRPIYPRGYPFSKRYKEEYTYTRTSGLIVMNMGLWVGDPDADAVTHLANPTKIVSMKDGYESIMLSPGTFAPINTQNTAFHRKLLPCYYYILMNSSLRGLKIDRYGDIWSGFLAKKAIDKMNERVSVGKPIVNHKRNTHDYFKDLTHELWGMILTEEIVNWLENLQLENNNYFDIYLEMARELNKMKNKFQEYAIRKYFEKVTKAMDIWIDACHKILNE